MSTIGKRIREVRQALRMSQEEFGAFFNSTKSYISAVENDKSKLSLESLVKLLLNYNVNINFILGGIGELFINTQTENLKNSIKNEVLSEIKAILINEGKING